MQQRTLHVLHVLKPKIHAYNDSDNGNKHITYRKMNTENVLRCIWLLMMMAKYERGVSRWE